MMLSFSGLVTANDACAPKSNSCMPTARAYKSFASNDVAACCAACQSDAALCMAYTVNHDRTTCFLHPASDAPLAQGHCTSGIVRSPTPRKPPAGAKNVLWLVADDMRPNLNKAYGQSYMVTPALDAFAKTALTFDRAFTNVAICSASRNSFMSGRVPDKTRTWNFINHFRQAGLSAKGGSVGANWVTLPQLFKNFNYTVLGHGKMYHPNKPPGNDPLSWTDEQEYVKLTTTGCPRDTHSEAQRFCPGVGKQGRTDDAAFSDFNTTESALHTLRTFATASVAASKPFMIALGLHFPHQPWAVPEWAADTYDASALRVAAHQDAPIGAPGIAFTAELDGGRGLALDESNPLVGKSKPANASGKLTYFDCPSPGVNNVPHWFQRQLRQGYYSAVTHTDRLFGKVLGVLDDLGVTPTTLVVVHSDHGWQLGEHGEWGKHTNWEQALRVPLLIRAPWAAASSAGRHTHSYTELIDLYRTIASLAGLPDESIASDVDGTNVAALLEVPATSLKEEAYAQVDARPPPLHRHRHRMCSARNLAC